jgi:flagellar biosynthesis/type III secretory pathway protein FliH
MNNEIKPSFTEHDLDAMQEIAENFNLEEEDPNYNLGYQMGYDTGYIDGFEEGQQTLVLEKEGAIYNEALNEIMNHVNSFDFDQKNDLLQVLRLLQRI